MDSFKFEKPESKVLYLRCRLCKELKIPWRTGVVGCPPDYCEECRKKLSDTGMTKWVRKDKPLKGPPSSSLRALALTVLKARNAIPTKTYDRSNT